MRWNCAPGWAARRAWILGLGLLAVVSCQRPAREAKSTKAAVPSAPSSSEIKKYLVRVAQATPTTLTDRCVFPGILEAWEKVSLSAEASGQVEELAIDVGSVVKKGDLIALIDSESMKAEFDAAQVRYDEAKRTFDRLETLFNLKNVTRDDLDKAQTAVRLAEAQFKVMKIMLDKSEVRSPLDGEVNQKAVEPGEFVNRSQPLCEIVVLDPLKLVVSVPEKDIAFIRDGMETLISVESLGIVDLNARVHQVALTGDTRTNTFPVEIEIPNPDRRIKAGMIGRATFIKRRLENALAVPLFAVVTRNQENYIFVAEGQKARMARVTLGVVDGDRVEIVQGLQPGDSVIVEGGRNLDDGSEIDATGGATTEKGTAP